MIEFTSRPYRPDPSKCCERCCFNSGRHAEFCKPRSWSESMKRWREEDPEGFSEMYECDVKAGE
jgi:hypothetical protein